MRWDAVILSGGRGRRLGGVDKASLVVAGRSLLDHAVAASEGAAARILVGPHSSRPGLPAVLEEPRWSGPAAALAAGLAALPEPAAPYVAVLAADQPAAVPGLRAVLAGVAEDETADGWVAQDPSGREQPLLAVYRRAALHAAVDELARRGALPGAALHRLLAGLTLTRVPLAAELCRDVDTPEDLAGCRPSTSERRIA